MTHHPLGFGPDRPFTIGPDEAPLLIDSRLRPTEDLIWHWVGAARTRTPSTTNYDAHSPTWGDGRAGHPPRAMGAADLGHVPS